MSRVLPILFNGDMVRAILDGRKTVTRRIVKHGKAYPGYHDRDVFTGADGNQHIDALYWKAPCQPGDIMYVRETFCPNYFDESIAGYWGDGLRGNRNAYKADYRKEIVGDIVAEPKWTPSIHMPKKAARIWLKVKDVRLERLQEMTASESVKEGIQLPKEYDTNERAYILGFADLWDSTIKNSDLDCYGWNANPYVWVIEFERCEKLEER